MATRADVAKLAKVSESTVSYVLSGKRPIGEETRKRVLKAIDKLGYKANYAASALAGGSPRMVTMMTENLFLTPPSRIDGALVDGIVSGVAHSGFHSVIWPISSDDDSDIQALVESNISGGVILMGVTDNDRRVRYLHERDVPFLVLGRTSVGFDYNYVDRDFETVYRNALKILMGHGHKNIGVLSGNSKINPYLKKASADLDVTLQLINSKNNTESGSEVARAFKENHSNISAILSLLDLATLGFVETCGEVGISIPHDLSIIGVNMLEEQAESSKIRISTIAFHAYEIAQSCGKMMVEIIKAGKGLNSKRKELWVGEYMDRGSIASVKARS
jgi:DNA-binding LacI/PurR family transcriptional regulator